MSTIDNGGPAYPVQDVSALCAVYGMTLLDAFALAETLGDFDDGWGKEGHLRVEALAGPMPNEGDFLSFAEWEAKARARLRYIRARAMLAEKRRLEGTP